MKIRLLPSDNMGRIQPKLLQEAIIEDKNKGLIPCFVICFILKIYITFLNYSNV